MIVHMLVCCVLLRGFFCFGFRLSCVFAVWVCLHYCFCLFCCLFVVSFWVLGCNLVFSLFLGLGSC